LIFFGVFALLMLFVAKDAVEDFKKEDGNFRG
jgi:hypothetical protein